LWAQVLVPDNIYRRQLIDQVGARLLEDLCDANHFTGGYNCCS
jgi:hypothetical protein